MDKFVDERDYSLLDRDKYTFFVMRQVMGGECKLLLSDHEKLVLCYTCTPYPVWIWTPDDSSAEDLERTYSLLKENSLLDGEHRFSVKYELAEYLIKRSSEEGRDMTISINMLAYDCPEPIKPAEVSNGGIYRCEAGDADELTGFIEMFHNEIGIDQKSVEEYRADAESFIDTGKVYFWKDEQGHNTASCKYSPEGSLASINLVYTRPEYRRKHYAENLVYEVSMIAKEAGYLPMLYTDANYAASNACYQKIGFIPRGRICTIK